MKGLKACFFAVVVCVLLGVAWGQELQCSTLDVGRDGDPISGSSLTLCRNESRQCCVQSYIDRVLTELGSDLLDGLEDQIGEIGEDVANILDRLEDYLEVDFLATIRSDFPFADILSNLDGVDIDEITEPLARFLNRAVFIITENSQEVNTTQVFLDIVLDIERRINDSGVLSSNQKSCLNEQIQMGINQTSLRVLGRTLEIIRESSSAFSRIADFLDNFDDTIDNLQVSDVIPQQYLNRLAEVSFCGRCTRRLPPLCANTCGALIRGSFAGYYSGLEREFDNLWMVVRELVDRVSMSIQDLFASEREFLNINFIQVAVTCGLTGLPFGRKRRQADDILLPETITRAVNSLSGVFVYNGLPEFCEVASDEVAFCGRNGGDNSDDRECDSDEVCTSSCQCWDGETLRMSDIEEFTGTTIAEQADNPVLSLPVEEYEKFARGLGTPVNSFLTSEEFMSVAPEGLTVPEPAPFGGSGFTLVVSVVTLLTALLFAFVSM